jgi:D-alanyl-D-alanine carboxypeptidase/D-alanyl-D-alanine-endopeptidase (penicillin-binding protein 4)
MMTLRPSRIVAVMLGWLLLGACANPKESSRYVDLAGRLDETLHRRDDGQVKYTARVIDLSDGRELYAVAPDEPFLPASNGKLAVSATALDRFGADRRLKTYLCIDGDDLWVIGSGDPGTGDPTIAKKYGKTVMTVFDEWADALLARGITRIPGKLYFWDGAFDRQLIHPSWSKGFAGDWYAAPVSGLNFNDNCIDVAITPTSNEKPPSYSVIPPTRRVKIVNKAVSGGGDDAEEASIDRKPQELVYTITGACTQPTELKSKSIIDPGEFFADALRTHLESRGITILGRSWRAESPLGGHPVPPDASVIAVHETRMSDIMGRINKQSQNMFAEAMCKLAGRDYLLEKTGQFVPGSWEAGSDAVKDFLSRLKIDHSGLVVADGSGLSRDNRVTSRLITDLLVNMQRRPDGAAFRRSLSVAGEDGTLRNRMKDIRGHVFAKTGYIGGVRACSGYVKTRGGRWLAFSIIYNEIDGSVSPYEALQDEAIRVLVAYPDIDSVERQPTTRPTTRRRPATAAETAAAR